MMRLAVAPVLILIFAAEACGGPVGNGATRAQASPQAAQAPASVAPAPAPSPSPLALGEDFTPEARLLYRVAACGGSDPIPANLDKTAIETHCAWLKTRVGTLKSGYLAKAEPYLAKLRPQGLPTTVVYPFGGGDLLSALTTYPDATDITTLSLEHAGDPRRLKDLDAPRLARSLTQLRYRISGLFAYNESTSENLMQMQRGDLPGQLSFFLVGLAVHGYEPVSLRYFTVLPDGKLHYLTEDEVAAEEKKTAKKLRSVWMSPDFSEAFSNMELTFQPIGGGPIRVHRHIALDLSDEHLKTDPSVLRYLESKGKVSAMTKAASYLMWNPGFSMIRSYLLDNMVFMFSDSTGIPPHFAREAGFIQETYGRFTGSFLPATKSVNEEFRKLWASQPAHEMDFRFGYPDAGNFSHLVVTRKPAPGEVVKGDAPLAPAAK
jgi:hypothetical protein